MKHGLTENDIIRMHHLMVAPVAVHEIIAGRESLDDTSQYTLDVMIAEFQADTALLCIALCAAHIADLHASSMPIAGSLGFEASRIVHEYGPLWIANADGKLTPAHENQVIDLLDHMPEDFEALADLLGALRSNLVEDSDSAIMTDILQQNAQAFMDFLEYQSQEERDTLVKSIEVRDNVITFPRQARLAH